MKKIVTCLLLLMLGIAAEGTVAVASINQESETEPVTEATETNKHLDSFDLVCSTIESTHWDKTLLGDAWVATKVNSRKAIEASLSIEEFRSSTRKLLQTLGQSHFAIVPQSAFEVIKTGKEKQSGHAGFDVRYIEESLVVTRVADQSPAQAAGVRPGWKVKLIGSLTDAEILDKAKQTAAHSPMRLETAVATACDSFLSGAIDQSLPLVFLDHSEVVRLVSVKLEQRPGEPAKLGKYLPDFYTEFEQKVLPDDVGYIRFNFFFGGPKTIRKYNEALKQFRTKKGVVIDIRGNRGGAGMMVVGMCNWFAKDPVALGTQLFSGDQHMNLVLNPRLPRFDRPVALLVDECSGSAAELMASGFKDLGFGRLFGNTTAGMALPSVSTRLPNGDGFLHAIAGYESASGREIEGAGVEPHELFKLKRSDFFKTPDPVLDQAKKWIVDQSMDANDPTQSNE